MKHTFALTTRQVAKLAGVEIPPIYMSVKRYGNWRGVVPSKSASSRLLWRSDEVHSALGIVPDQADMTNGEWIYCQFLEAESLPVTGESWAVGQAFLSPKADQYRDPTLFLNEVALAVEVVNALCNRLDSVLPVMDETVRKHATEGLVFIAQTVCTLLNEEANHV